MSPLVPGEYELIGFMTPELSDGSEARTVTPPPFIAIGASGMPISDNVEAGVGSTSSQTQGGFQFTSKVRDIAFTSESTEIVCDTTFTAAQPEMKEHETVGIDRMTLTQTKPDTIRFMRCIKVFYRSGEHATLGAVADYRRVQPQRVN